MMTITRLLYSYYKYLNEDLSDPRTAKWFLVGSPWKCVAIIAVYLHIVQISGPAFMKKRRPYNLKKVIAVYNVVQIILNVYIAYEGIAVGWFWKYKVICEPVNFSNDPDALRIANAVWFFYMVKIFDLVDTIFFILRKKENQASFLHIYHHAGMVFALWACTRYLPGGHGTSLGLINSVVHIFMYTHYFLTSLDLGKLWWKKYITRLQLFQFFAIFIHYSVAILTKDCEYPKWPLTIFIPQNLFMMVLFGDFYYKSYMKKKPEDVDKNGVSNTTESKQNGVELPNGKSKTH